MFQKDDEDDKVADYLLINDGEVAFTFEMQFPEGLKSKTYDEATGSAKETVSGTDGTVYLQDIEDEDLFMLGETFSIVEAIATNSSTSVTGLSLTLMGGAVVDTLKEGETKTYEIDGKTYEVTVIIIADSNDAGTDSRVKLMINGEVTKQLSEGDTDTLDDGTVIGIDDVLANEGAEAEGEDLVSFYLGANKIVLEDGNVATSPSSGSVEIDEEKLAKL